MRLSLVKFVVRQLPRLFGATMKVRNKTTIL